MTEREPSRGDWSHEIRWPHGEGWGWYDWDDASPWCLPSVLHAALPDDPRGSMRAGRWMVYATRAAALLALLVARDRVPGGCA